jgi:hypothetical protein
VFQPNGISLHVEDHGFGKPVVLVHGWVLKSALCAERKYEKSKKEHLYVC